jgi:putative tryptophan/tyrosine transport system substrate-binding protein
VKRREFVKLLGGAAATWPLAARAQQSEGMRRVGVVMGWDENDAEAKVWLSGFTQGLSELGWTDGRNLRMDIRWVPGNMEQMRTFAKELVDLKPDVILANSTPVTAALHRETQTVPIVFVIVSDPVGGGFVESFPRPGGNITGFVHNEPTLGSKWVELLRQIAPGVKRVAAMFNPETAPYAKSYYVPSIEGAAQSFKMTSNTAPVHNDAEIEAVITSLAREPMGGLIVMPDNFVDIHRAQIISLALQNHVPAVYQIPVFVRGGGLISYGTDFRDIFHRSASYVDRILRGAKPADLPVQLPVKFVMAVNVKTARALGLTVPQTVLATADEVIE